MPQVNKLKCLTLFLLLLLCLPVRTAAAEERCRISGTPVKTLPGKTIQIPFAIEGNPGFTNFGIGLEFDNQQLELKEILTVGTEGTYLCGNRVSSNTAWVTPEGKTQGFVSAASKDKITANSTLFVASFAVKDTFSGETQITPQIHYLRSYEETIGFMDIPVMADPVNITALAKGDINMDGVIEYDDVIAVYGAAVGENQLTDTELEFADWNGNGVIEQAEAEGIYKLYTGGE